MATNQQDHRESDNAGGSALEDLQARLAKAMQAPLLCLAEPTPESVALHDAIDDFAAQVSWLGLTVRRLKVQRADEPAN